MKVKVKAKKIQIRRVNARIISPRIPVSTKDPVGASLFILRANKSIARRFKELKSGIISLFNLIPVSAVNAEGYNYQYDFSSVRAAMFIEEVQRVIDGIVMDDTQPMNSGQFWMSIEVAGAYSAGTAMAHQQLAAMSPLYSESRTVSDILYSDPYLQRLAIANASTYSDWRGLSDTARNDLSQVIMDGIARGLAPGSVAESITKRLGVNESKAKAIAQTEITGILRKANRDEVQESKIILGLNSAMFWISALLPTTRRTHAARSGKAYSPEECDAFYSVDGNRYRCHCSQTPCMLNDDGSIIILESSLQKVIGVRDKWLENYNKKKPLH